MLAILASLAAPQVRGRLLVAPGDGPGAVSGGYLALTDAVGEPAATDAVWRNWYVFFPWEDWRAERPAIINRVISPALRRFVANAASPVEAALRRTRARVAFGLEGSTWDEEKVLERYELLYEAALVDEARRDGRTAQIETPATLGASMMFDHRRILATAIARLRGKMKYRPVVFELLPSTFTLLELQQTVEAISGIRLHKQNFRRLVEERGLVERTGRFRRIRRGRPAELFSYRPEVLRERPAPGVRLGFRRTGS
jgi:hypothetical protein